MNENNDEKEVNSDGRTSGCLAIFVKIVVAGIVLIALVFGTCILMLK